MEISIKNNTPFCEGNLQIGLTKGRFSPIMKSMRKNKQTRNFPIAGADELTPSRSEYFSWINNTNEGSTEEQTLVDLAFFRYLLKTYSMHLDIYALDAGNLDGAGGGYDNPNGEKLRAQFPHGYGRIARAAQRMGTRLGVWGGADGYGTTEQEISARRKILVDLCKKHHFALFKFDTVCGELRLEMRKEFAKTMRLCRTYCPDLILLNHRNDLGEASKYATTFLWEGHETYADVHNYNPCTAPHNRACMFFRGNTPDLKRLTEDHGVCISSSPAYFEDELIYQAFGRCLILAPEIYGNPWLLKDSELPALARVFNLHRRHREILVHGMLPDETLDLGDNAVLRGDERRRFLATGNGSWEKRTIEIPLDERIGLYPCASVCVTRRFPTEKLLGVFAFGAKIEVELPAFRAALFEICDLEVADVQLSGCEYFVQRENKRGNILQAEILCGTPSLFSPHGAEKKLHEEVPDVRVEEPQFLQELCPISVPDNAEELYETAMFFADNDPLEARSLRRAGETAIPEVRAAREMFFSQFSYRTRGIDPSIPFNGKDDAFDFKSRSYYNFDGRKGFRVEGGCLRVDFREIQPADRIEIEYFEAETPLPEFEESKLCDHADISSDLRGWENSPLVRKEEGRERELTYLAYYVDVPKTAKGKVVRAVYSAASPFRFFRLDCPPDHIISIKRFAGEREIESHSPHLTNLFAPYHCKKSKAARAGEIVLPHLPKHPYLAVAVEGETGNENVTCCLKYGGKLYAFPERAPAYPSNAFEYHVHPVEGFYTFFFPLKSEMEGGTVEIVALFAGKDVPVHVWLCDEHTDRGGILLSLPKK